MRARRASLSSVCGGVCLVGAALLSGCPALLGIDHDYSVGSPADGSAANDAGGSAHDAHAHDASHDARTPTDVVASQDRRMPADAQQPPNDQASPPDVVPDGDSMSPLDAPADVEAGPGDACSDSCPCDQALCGSSCVDESTDINNCGACGQACTTSSPSIASCAAGRCVVKLAAGGGTGAGVAVDSSNVYWANGASVLKVPLSGGSVTTLASSGVPFQVAVDGQLYWTSLSGAVVVADLDGSNTTTLGTGTSANPPNFLAVNGSLVYWTTQTTTTTGTVVEDQRARVGSPEMTVASSEAVPSGIACQDNLIFWADFGQGGSHPGAIMTSSAIFALGTASLFVAATAPYDVVADATSVYWTDQGTSAVMKSARMNSGFMGKAMTGGTPVTLAAHQTLPKGIAVDSSNVYWTNPGANAVMKVAIGGGTPTTIASVASPQFVAVDGTSVYFTTADSGGDVYKVTPK